MILMVMYGEGSVYARYFSESPGEAVSKKDFEELLKKNNDATLIEDSPSCHLFPMCLGDINGAVPTLHRLYQILT